MATHDGPTLRQVQDVHIKANAMLTKCNVRASKLSGINFTLSWDRVTCEECKAKRR